MPEPAVSLGLHEAFGIPQKYLVFFSSGELLGFRSSAQSHLAALLGCPSSGLVRRVAEGVQAAAPRLEQYGGSGKNSPVFPH